MDTNQEFLIVDTTIFICMSCNLTKLSLQAESNVQRVLVSDPRDGVPSFGLVEQGRTESMEVTIIMSTHYRSIYAIVYTV